MFESNILGLGARINHDEEKRLREETKRFHQSQNVGDVSIKPDLMFRKFPEEK